MEALKYFAPVSSKGRVESEKNINTIPVLATEVNKVQREDTRKLDTKIHNIEKEIKYLTKKSYIIENNNKSSTHLRTEKRREIKRDLPPPCPPGYNIIIIEANGTREKNIEVIEGLYFRGIEVNVNKGKTVILIIKVKPHLKGIKNFIRWTIALGEWAYLTGRQDKKPEKVDIDERVKEIINKTCFSVKVDYYMPKGRIRDYFQDSESNIEVSLSKNRVKFGDEFMIVLKISKNAPKGMYHLRLLFETKFPRGGYASIQYSIIVRVIE